MKTLFSLFRTRVQFSIALLFLFISAPLLLAQVPGKINYSALAEENDEILAGTDIELKFTICKDSPAGLAVWNEEHAVTTEATGRFNIQLGSKTLFEFDWNTGPYYLKVELRRPGGSYTDLGSSQLLSVPYALNAQGVGNNLTITGNDTASDDPLFEVKRSDGQTVFAVYNSGIRMYIEEDSGKGSTRGGFAIGGFGQGSKNETGEYFRVTTDSVRIYLDNTQPKGSRGGFAIGGFHPGTKGMEQEYLRVTEDSTRIYVDNTAKKGSRGGFAIGGFHPGSKSTVPQFINLSPENYFIGHESGEYSKGTRNAFIGYRAGRNNMGGDNNVLIGYEAGYNMGGGESDNNNTIIGFKAGYYGRGTDNVILGSLAAEQQELANNCVIIGKQAGQYLSGHDNILIGNSAGLNTRGTMNLAIGINALSNSSGGTGNIALGQNSGLNNQGGYNVFIGQASGIGNSTGSNNLYIGPGSGMGNQKGSGNIFLGNNAGRNVVEECNNELWIDNSQGATPLIWGNFTDGAEEVIIGGILEAENVAPSDIRLKTNISTIEGSLSKISKIRGVYYDWDPDRKDVINVRAGRQVGVIAQEVEQVLPELVRESNKGYKTVEYQKITAVLIEAIKEQQEIIEELEKRVESLEGK